MNTERQEMRDTRRQLSLYVNSPEREALLRHTEDHYETAKSLSDAVFAALEEWRDVGDVGRRFAPFAKSTGSVLITTGVLLAKEKDQKRIAQLYEGVLLCKLGEVAVEILRDAAEILSRAPLSSQAEVLRSVAESLEEDGPKLDPSIESEVKDILATDAVLRGIDNKGDHWRMDDGDIEERKEDG